MTLSPFARVPAVIMMCVICALSTTGCRQDQIETPELELSATQQAIAECLRNNATSLSIRSPVVPADLLTLAGLSQLRTLEIYQASFPQEQLRQLSDLRQLECLRLEDLALGDRAVSCLKGWPRLKILNLPSSKLTDAGLAELLSFLPDLQLLRIGSSSMTDEGVVQISKCSSLRFLHLIDVPVTDASLRHFHDKHQLESLYIDGGRETDSGIRDLLQANPRLHFHRNQLHVADDPNADGH